MHFPGLSLSNWFISSLPHSNSLPSTLNVSMPQIQVQPSPFLVNSHFSEDITHRQNSNNDLSEPFIYTLALSSLLSVSSYLQSCPAENWTPYIPKFILFIQKLTHPQLPLATSETYPLEIPVSFSSFLCLIPTSHIKSAKICLFPLLECLWIHPLTALSIPYTYRQMGASSHMVNTKFMFLSIEIELCIYMIQVLPMSCLIQHLHFLTYITIEEWRVLAH